MKKIIATTALVAAAAAVTAQTVTSANIVGYNKLDNSALELTSAQFYVGEANSIDDVFGDQLPVGSKVYKYTPGSGYGGNISTFSSVFLGGTAWSVDLELVPGEAFWVETPSAAPSITAGEVPMESSVTNNIVPGLQLMSYPYPVEVSISDMNLTPTVGDKIYKYDPVNGYGGNISTFSSVFLGGTAWNVDLVFGVGEGFWYESAAAGTVEWVEARPF